MNESAVCSNCKKPLDSKHVTFCSSICQREEQSRRKDISAIKVAERKKQYSDAGLNAYGVDTSAFRHCVVCGGRLKCHQKKYCSQVCFQAGISDSMTAINANRRSQA
jgi:predicted nucleic acid-binding Zn ribbon protein